MRTSRLPNFIWPQFVPFLGGAVGSIIGGMLCYYNPALVDMRYVELLFGSAIGFSSGIAIGLAIKQLIQQTVVKCAKQSDRKPNSHGAFQEEFPKPPLVLLFRAWPPKWSWLFILACFGSQLLFLGFGVFICIAGAISVVLVTRDTPYGTPNKVLFATLATITCWSVVYYAGCVWARSFWDLPSLGCLSAWSTNSIRS